MASDMAHTIHLRHLSLSSKVITNPFVCWINQFDFSQDIKRLLNSLHDTGKVFRLALNVVTTIEAFHANPIAFLQKYLTQVSRLQHSVSVARAQCYKTFWVCNKIECLCLASFSSLVLCLWVRPGAYPRGQHLKRRYTWVGSSLTHKH
jgi:hypothetical protein